MKNKKEKESKIEVVEEVDFDLGEDVEEVSCDIEKIEEEVNSMIKSDLRYILYRKRNSLEEDSVIFDLNEDVVVFFERDVSFKRCGGWPEFARKWDVQKDADRWLIVPRKNSEMREWDAVLTYRTEIFPTLSGGIYKNIVKK